MFRETIFLDGSLTPSNTNTIFRVYKRTLLLRLCLFLCLCLWAAKKLKTSIEKNSTYSGWLQVIMATSKSQSNSHWEKYDLVFILNLYCAHIFRMFICLFHYHKLIYCTYNVFYLVMCNTASVAVVEHLTIVWIGDGFGRSWAFCPVRKLRRIVMVNKMDNISICVSIVVSVITHI